MNESTYLLDSRPKKSKAPIYATMAAIGGFVCGYDTGSISGIIALPVFQQYFYHSSSASAYYESLLLASYLVTSMLGSLLSAYFCDRKGRRATILFASCLLLLGISFEMSGLGIRSVLLGRLTGGIGTGLMTNAIPLYLSEISPSAIRGRLISVFSLLTSLGQMIGYFVTFASSFIDKNNNICWRLPWLIQFIICFLFAAVSFFYLPCSPRWLVKQGKHTMALETLCLLFGLEPNHKLIQKEYSEIIMSNEDNYREPKSSLSSFADLFKTKKNRIRTLISFFISFANGMTGNVVIFYFAPQIFIKTGLNSVSSSLALSGGVGLLSLLATTISLFYWIDRYGRRTLFFVGSTILGVCMMSIGILFHYFVSLNKDDSAGGNDSLASSYLIICFIYIFSTAYSGTWGVANYVYTAEIFTTHCRAKGLSLTYAISWISSIVLTFGAPYLFAYSISGVYFFFGICSMVTLVGIYFIPETKGKSLEGEED